MGITGMAVGTVVGACANFLLQFAVLLRVKWQYRPPYSYPIPGLSKCWLISRYIGPFITPTQSNHHPKPSFGTGAPLPPSAGQPPDTVSLGSPWPPLRSISNDDPLVAQGQMDAFETFSKGLRSILFVTIPPQGLIVLRVPLVSFCLKPANSPPPMPWPPPPFLYYCLGLAQSGIRLLPGSTIHAGCQTPQNPVITMVLNTG